MGIWCLELGIRNWALGRKQLKNVELFLFLLPSDFLPLPSSLFLLPSSFFLLPSSFFTPIQFSALQLLLARGHPLPTYS
jgi:hypothetical protein